MDDVPQPRASPRVDLSAEFAASVRGGGTRCEKCNRKVGMLGFSCKCKGVFCAEHRHAEMHECAFDYKATHRKQLAENNPVVRGTTLETIAS